MNTLGGVTYDPRIHDRRSIRLPSFDYRQFGAYFLTICSHLKEPVFGEIAEEAIVLNDWGEIVEQEWLQTDAARHYVGTDQYVVMPNHFHGILWLRRGVVQLSNVQPQSLGAVVRAFKSASTKRINELRGTPGAPVWQRNYYERVIRDDAELNRARDYIINNPVKWSDDPESPSFRLASNLQPPISYPQTPISSPP